MLVGSLNISLPSWLQGASYSNPCSDSGPDCSSRWTTAAAIPREYLPFQVTKFNAYAIHGEPWGEAAPEEIFYESLYPADPEVVPAPDFHYLDAFQPIDLEGEVGYQQSEEESELWVQATSTHDVAYK